MSINHPYCIVYRSANGVEHEEYFETELDMENYVNIWIDGDEDYIDYFYYDVEYIPPWAQ